LKINQFLKVESPPDDYLARLQNQMGTFHKIIEGGDLVIQGNYENEDIAIVSKSLAESTIEDPIERGVATLLSYQGYNEPEQIEEIIEEEQEGELTIFSSLSQSGDAPPVLSPNTEVFSQAILSPAQTRNDLSVVERLSGKKDKQANNIAAEIIKDIQMATFYPPDTVDEIGAPELTEIVSELCSAIDQERQRAASSEGEDAF